MGANIGAHAASVISLAIATTDDLLAGRVTAFSANTQGLGAGLPTLCFTDASGMQPAGAGHAGCVLETTC